MMTLPPTRVSSADPDFTFGNFRLTSDGVLFRGDELIHLPPKELSALRVLLGCAGQVVDRSRIKQELWGDVHVTGDSVPRCMSSLRARLEPDHCIQTVYKRGYRLAVSVTRQGAGAVRPHRLAIMPFATGQGVDEHLGPAIAEEAGIRLTEPDPPTVCVLARDSVFTLARRGHTAAEVGKALEADLVLTGTLLATPWHFRLRVEMVRVEDGTQIWVEDMLAPRSRVTGLELELVHRLTVRLGAEFQRIEAEHFDMANSDSRRDAYEKFLRGHHEWQSFERHRMMDAMQSLLLATEIDPGLVAARVDLAHVIIAQELCGFMPPRVASDRIRNITRAGGELPGDPPSLLPAQGWMCFHVERDLAAALEMFSQSATVPHDGWTTRLRVLFALSRHRFTEAADWLNAALLIDPYAPWLHARLAWTYHLAGDPDRSMTHLEESLRLFPEQECTQLYGSILLACYGDGKRAEKMAQALEHRSPYFDIAAAVHAYTLARVKREGESREILERLQWLSRERFVMSSFIPAVYVALGDLESAVAELRTADEARCPWFFQMLADPRLTPLRGHPEFIRMKGSLEDLEATAAASPEILV